MYGFKKRVKHKTLAIPIRVVNWSDSSQILSLFTRDFGILEAIAKGAHRSRNAFQGPFDLCRIWEVVFAERNPDRGLSILTEGIVFEDLRGIRDGLSRWIAASFLIEYLRAVGTAGEPSQDLFDAAAGTLAALHRPENMDCLPGGSDPETGMDGIDGERYRISAALLSFESRALRILGLSAPITSCTECGRPWPRTDRPVFFSAQGGGIICTGCRERLPPRQGRMVSGGTIRAYELLASRKYPPPGRYTSVIKFQLAPVQLRQLDLVLRDLRLFLLERDFKMLKYGPIFHKPKKYLILGNERKAN